MNMRAYILPLSMALAAALAGCSFEPTYQRPALPVAPSYPQGPAYGRPGGAGAAQGLPAADIGWRDFFGDPRLRGLIALALRNNRDLRVSALNVQEAAAQYRIVRAGLLPTLQGGASLTRARVPADLSSSGQVSVASDYSVGLGMAAWELDFWGRVRSLKHEALARYLASAQARKAAEISLVSQVADQYLAVRAYDEQLEITDQTLRAAQASYKIAKLKFDVGAGSELDLREAEGVAEQAQANRSAQERLRAQAVNALTLLVGESLPMDLPAALSLDDQRLLADIPAGLPSELLTRRPDIMQAEQTLRAANADIGAARAAFFPTIALTGQFGTGSARLDGLFKPGSGAWSFAPQITLPIFDAGVNRANLDIAKLEKNVAIAQYEKAIQTAFREVADGLAARGTYDSQIASLERFVNSQKRRLDLSTLMYSNGATSYLAVLTAQTDLYSAQQALVTARMERLSNLVQLYQYLGGGWLEHTGDAPRPADALDANG